MSSFDQVRPSNKLTANLKSEFLTLLYISVLYQHMHFTRCIILKFTGTIFWDMTRLLEETWLTSEAGIIRGRVERTSQSYHQI